MPLTDRYGPENAPDQVLVIATGHHAPGSGLTDVPAATASALALGKVLGSDGSGARRHVRLLTEPADVKELGEAIADAAERATGLLLVYYIGHGVLGPGGDLYLATCATDSSKAVRLAHTALPCAMLANYLLSSRATARAVVLDCCFSAHSFTRLGGTRTYVIASASEDALAPSGTVVTPFTAAVIDVLSSASAGVPPRVTLDDLYREVASRLTLQGAHPRRLGADAVGDTNLSVLPHRRTPRTPVPDGTAPYPGLAAFETHQAAFFHGRERELTELLVILAERVRHARPLAVTAPSGTGKSSLLRAGMLAAVRTDRVPVPGMSDWPVAFFEPGRRPVAALRGALAAALRAPDDARLAEAVTAGAETLRTEVRLLLRQGAGCGAGGERRLLLVVDQFEQALTAAPQEREMFLTALEALWRPNGSEPSPAVLVYAVKLDFYGSCMAAPQLTDAAAPAPMLLGPLFARQIERMITGPALQAGLRVDDGLAALVNRDLAELSGGSVVDAQFLPLVAHALRCTHEHGDGARMTVADYLAVGGAPEALARTASTVFTSLDFDAREALRALLPLLVHIGDDVPDTARQATKTEMLHHAPDPPSARRAVGAFVRARLMREVDGPVAAYELAHESLLRHWPEMREAVAEGHESRATERRVRTDAEAWEAAGRDPGLLYRGARLDLAVEHGKMPDVIAEPVTVTFLEESVRARRRERLQAARQRGQRLALAALLVVVTVLAPALWSLHRSNGDLTVARDSQTLTEAARRLRPQQQSAAMQVSYAAWRQSRNLASRSALLNTAGIPPTVPLTDHNGPVHATAISAQDLVATSGYGESAGVRLADLSDPFRPEPIGDPLSGPTGHVLDLAFSPDGRTLLAAEDNGVVRRWDLSRPGTPKRLPSIPPPRGSGAAPDKAHVVAFDDSGRRLAVAHESGWTLLYDARSLKRVGELRGAPGSWASAVAWSHDGELLATASGRNPEPSTVQFWSVGDGRKPVEDGPAHGGELDDIVELVFSPDDERLLGVTTNGSLATRVWYTEDRRTDSSSQAVLRGPDGAASDVVNLPARRLIAVSGVDRTIRLLTEGNFEPVLTLEGPAPVASLAANRDGSALVAGYFDGSVRVWPLTGPLILGSGKVLQTVATAPDSRLAAISDSAPAVRLWDLTDPREPAFRASLPPPPGPAGVTQSLAFAPKRHLLAGAFGKGYAVLWDISDTGEPELLGEPLPVADGALALSVALSPDGRLMAAGTAARDIYVWDITDPLHPVPLGDPLQASAQVEDLTFSPDSGTLVSGALDGQVSLWNTVGIGRPTVLTRPRIASATGVNTLAYSADGRVLAIGCGDGSVRLWGMSEPGRPKALAPLEAASGPVYSVAFAPGGRGGRNVLSAGYGDGSIRFWDLSPQADGRLSAIVAASARQVKGVAFTSDGRTLLGVDASGTGVAWFVEPGQAGAYVCAVSGPPLREAVWKAELPGVEFTQPCGTGSS